MKKLLAFILVSIILILGGCTNKETDWETLNFYDAFGGIGVNVTIIAEKSRIKNEMESTWNDINTILIDFDNIFSINHNENQVETVIQKVNRNAGIAPVVVPEEVIYVLEKAIEVSALSKDENDVAQYDITIAPVWEEWDFIRYMAYPYDAKLPDPIKLNELVKLVDYRKIKIDKEASTVYLEQEGMGIDLGSIAKGYAADKLRDYLLSKNFTRALINVGGNLITMGESYLFEEKKDIPWKIMITTPYVSPYTEAVKDTYYIGSFDDTDVTTVTSGVYERYITVDEVEYHHILDPGTGYPRESNLLSISIITENSMIAVAFSTTVFSLGLDKGLRLVENTPGMDAIAITVDKEIYVTTGLENNFDFNENVEEIGYVYKGVYRWN